MRNEKTSERISTLAGRILSGGKFTMKELRSVIASALTQARDKIKRKRP